MTKPNHCIWPIRTHYTFVSTNEQFAPNEDDLAMVQRPSTITILYIWSLKRVQLYCAQRGLQSANKSRISQVRIVWLCMKIWESEFYYLETCNCVQLSGLLINFTWNRKVWNMWNLDLDSKICQEYSLSPKCVLLHGQFLDNL